MPRPSTPVPLWSRPRRRREGGGSEEGREGGGGFGRTPPSSFGPPMVPSEEGEGGGGGGVQGEGGRGGSGEVTPPPPTVYGRSNTSLAAAQSASFPAAGHQDRNAVPPVIPSLGCPFHNCNKHNSFMNDRKKCWRVSGMTI